MRVVADPESSSDLREIELRRHLQMMARYVERAKAGSCLTIILRFILQGRRSQCIEACVPAAGR